MINDFNIDGLPVPLIIIRSSNFEIKQINTAAAQLLYLPKNKIIGHCLIELIEQQNVYYAGSNDINIKQLFEEEILKFKSKFNVNSRVTLPDLSTTAGVLYNLTAKPFAEHEDLSIIQAVEQPKQNNSVQEYQRVNQALKTSNIGVFQYNPTTLACYFSESFLALLHIPIHENNSWDELERLIFPEDIDSFAAFFLNHKLYGIPLNFDFRVVLNNEVQWFNLSGDSSSNIDIIGTLSNCTHEKSIFNQLNNAIESKNIVMKVGNIGTWQAEKNKSGQWDWNWDHIANDMLELDVKDIGNLEQWGQRLHPEDKKRVLSEIKKSLTTGNDFSSKYRALLPNNTIKYFLGEGIVGLDENGGFSRIDGLCVDETERINAQLELKELNKQLEKRVFQRTDELNKAKRKAEKSSQIKSDFLSMFSHELRTPMNAIIGSLDLLQTMEQTGETSELIDTARISAENLVLILNDILDINKIEAGKMLVERFPFSISSLLDNIVHVFLPIAQKNKIILSVEEDPNIEQCLLGDSVRLQQILFNLISNALKFTPSNKNYLGFVSIKVKKVNVLNGMSIVSFEISDNGIGINKKNQKKLFKPFTQAQTCTTRKYGGTGLGLNICDQLTRLMSGEIKLVSQLNKGSSFTVTFPFKQLDEPMNNKQRVLAESHISFCAIDNLLTDKLLLIDEYIIAEGATTSLIKLNDYNQEVIKADTFIIYINEFSPKLLDELSQFHSINLNLNNTLILCPTAYLLDVSRHFYNFKVMAHEPLTKITLLKELVEIQNAVANAKPLLTLDINELNLDEFDLLTANSPATKEIIIDDKDKIILVVEDNDLNQALIKKQLLKLGFDCDLAINGDEGKNRWLEGKYQIILTDCHMPITDGYEMTKKIRILENEQQKLPIPIIAITGAAMTGDEQKCFEAGMSDFVSKPIKLVDLNKILKQWLNYEER
jgi:signal transduction histidine kinase/CheY-like chemotaxis protein